MGTTDKQQNKVPELRFSGFSGEWEISKLKDVATYRRGSFPQPYGLKKWYDKENGMPFVQVFDVSDDFKLKPDTKSKISKLAQPMSVFVPKDSVVLTIQGSIGRIAITQYDAYVDRTLLIFKELLQPFDLLFFVYSIHLCFEVEKRKAPGGTIKTITKEALSEFTMPVPELKEQQKIADFLGSVDDWLDNLRQQKTALETYKRGMMQKIFTQQVRFKDENAKDFPEWKNGAIGEYLEEKTQRNRNYESQLALSVSNKNGFVIQEEHFNNYRVASKDTKNYKLVHKEEFAFNPSRINVGSIALLKKHELGIVSPMYVVFATRDKLLPEYLLNFTSTHQFTHQVKMGLSGSVRNSLSYEALTQFRISLPCVKEQQKIAEFLTSIDKSIESKQQQIAKAEEWKKGLMQKMFV